MRFSIRDIFMCALCTSASHVRCHPLVILLCAVFFVHSFFSDRYSSFSFVQLLFLSCLCKFYNNVLYAFLSVFFLSLSFHSSYILCVCGLSLYIYTYVWTKSYLRATAVGGGYGKNFVRRASCAHVPYTLEGRAKKNTHQMKSEIRWENAFHD